jgi:hypothetical protein
LLKVQPGNAADYTVVVSNSYGSATSVLAQLTVIPVVEPQAPRLVGEGTLVAGNHSFGVQLPTENGFNYTLEFADHLANPPINWQAVPGATVAGDGTTKTLTDADATVAMRFYRVKVTPAN